MAAALELAVDCRLIAQTLPERVPSEIRETIKRFLKGSLHDAGPTRANQARSQLASGAILLAAGLRVGVPEPRAGKRPDYEISLDTLPLGVEVKRPGVEGLIDANMAKAKRQLIDYGAQYHVVILDVSDCLVAAARTREIARQPFDPIAWFSRIATDSAASFRMNDRGFALVVTAQAIGWWDTGSHVASPGGFGRVSVEVVSDNFSRLLLDQGQRFRSALVRGWEEVGAAVAWQRMR